MPRSLTDSFIGELEKRVSAPVFLLEFSHGSYEYHYWTGRGTVAGYVSDGAILDLPEFNETFGLQANDFRIKLPYRKTWTDSNDNQREIELSDVSQYRGKSVKLMMNYEQATSSFLSDPSTDALTIFEGTISEIKSYTDAEESYYELVAESPLVNLNTNKVTRYSNQDQINRFSNDKGLEYSRQAQNSLFIQRGEVTPENLYARKIIYGEHKVDGDCVFSSISGNNGEFLNLVFAFADHEIESYEMIYLDDRQVWETGTTTYHSNFNPDGSLQLVNVYTKDGADDQTSITELTAEVGSDVWSTNHRLRGVAYVYVRCQYQTNIFGSEIPRCSALIKGKKVLDTRTSTTAYSDNPALCLRDFLSSSRYGLNTSLLSNSHFNTAANVCDELLDITLGTETLREPRFSCSAVLSTEDLPSTNINKLLKSFAGSITFASGVFHVYAGHYSPSSRVITLDDIYGEIRGYNKNYREVYNRALGTYIDPEGDYRRDEYPPFILSSYEESDERRLTMDFDTVGNTRQCQRLAKIAVMQSREVKYLSFNTGLSILTATAGDTVEVTVDQSEINGLYKIINLSVQFDPIQVQVTLISTSAKDYEFLDSEYTEKVIPAAEPASNIIDWVNAKLPAPTFSRSSSNFYDDFNLEILFDSDHTCFFTTDGTIPAINASKQPQGTTQTYTSAISISSSTDGEVVDVKAFVVQTSGSLQSFVSTVSFTYIAPTNRLSRPIGVPQDGLAGHLSRNVGWRIGGGSSFITPTTLQYKFKVPTMPAGSEFDNARSGLTFKYSFDNDVYTAVADKSEGDIVTVNVGATGDSTSTLARKAQGLTAFLEKTTYISSSNTEAYTEPFMFFGSLGDYGLDIFDDRRYYQYNIRPWSLEGGTLFWRRGNYSGSTPTGGFNQIAKGAGYLNTDIFYSRESAQFTSSTNVWKYDMYLVTHSGYTSPTYRVSIFASSYDYFNGFIGRQWALGIGTMDVQII